jgi:hypothetical protein
MSVFLHIILATETHLVEGLTTTTIIIIINTKYKDGKHPSSSKYNMYGD